MKKNLIIAMLLLLILGWYMTMDAFLGNDARYQEEIRKAQELEEKEIYITAISHYEAALTYKPEDYNAMYGIACDYKNLDEMNEYEKQMKTIIKSFDADEKTLSELYGYYIAEEEYDDAAELVYELKKKYPDNELVNKLYDERKGDYSEKFVAFEGLSSYCKDYAVFSRNDGKGLVDSDGDVEIDAKYTSIGYPAGNEDYIPVTDKNKSYFINDDGYKIAEPNDIYSYLASESNGCHLAQKNGKYGYLDDESYEEKTEFEWDDATVIYKGIGAVKKADKWALINKEFELVTEYIYDDVIQNEWKICSGNGRIWVSIGGKYQLVDEEGQVLTKDYYDGAKIFVDDQPCAVMKNGNWGFVNSDGTEFLTPQYEDADSFSMGFAPVMSQHQWGLIDENNKLVIDYYFDDMKTVNTNGIIPVKKEELWSLIQLKIFE